MESNYHQNIQLWQQMPSEERLNQLLDKVRVVNYGEVFRVEGVSLVAMPSGNYLGGAVWEVEQGQEKTLVLSGGSFEKYLHSQSLSLKSSHYQSILCLEDFNSQKQPKRYDAQISSLFHKISQLNSASTKQANNTHSSTAVVLPVKHPLFLLDLMD